MNYSELLGHPVASERFLATGTSGSGARLTHLTLNDGRELVAKQGRGLGVEAYMLRLLSARSDLPVPTIWYDTDDLLIMDYLDGTGRLTPNAEEQAADAVAALHGIEADRYGLECETIIGALPQPNPQMADWRTFFAEARLMYMGEHAVREGRLDTATLSRLEAICSRLDELIPDPAPPTLIHGDLWGGNVLVGPGGLSGFIDPAVYHADPEIELAFSTLFNTFGDVFFARYNEHRPIKPGFWEVRRDLYNLYPLLVHVRLFGGGYAGQVTAILDRLG